MRFNTLQEWLSWQETLHPQEIDLGLDRVEQVLGRLALDPVASTIISVAGTNGKGSSVAMLKSIYSHAGYRVGAYTSPHFVNYNERIQIDGVDVSDEHLCRAFEEIDQARGDISLSYFEFGTLAAFCCLADAGLDVALLEVGLGGRLDAVNTLSADAALLTSIDLDHMDWLGETREEIGFEKAGVFREGQLAVVGDVDPPVSVVDHARAIGADLQLNGTAFSMEANDGNWRWSGNGLLVEGLLPIFGGSDQQANNAAAVIAVVQGLQSTLPLSESQIVNGLNGACIAGRFQEMSGKTRIFLDTAHNPAAAGALRNAIEARGGPARWHAVFAVMEGKDIAGIIEVMNPVISSWHLADLDAPRAASAEKVYDAMDEDAQASAIISHQSVLECVTRLSQTLLPDDHIIVFGSFFVVAEILRARDA